MNNKKYKEFNNDQISVLNCDFKTTFINGWDKQQTYSLICQKISLLFSQQKELEYPEQLLILQKEKEESDVLKACLLKECKNNRIASKIEFLTFQEFSDLYPDNPESTKRLAQDKKSIFLVGLFFSKEEIKKLKRLFSGGITPFFWQYEEDLIGDAKKEFKNFQEIIKNSDEKEIPAQENINFEESWNWESSAFIETEGESDQELDWVIKKIQKFQDAGLSYNDFSIYVNSWEERIKIKNIFAKIFQNEFSIFKNWINIAKYKTFGEVPRETIEEVLKFPYPGIYGPIDPWGEDNENLQKFKNMVQEVQKNGIKQIELLFDVLGIGDYLINSYPERWNTFKEIIADMGEYTENNVISRFKETVFKRCQKQSIDLIKVIKKLDAPETPYAFIVDNKENTEEHKNLAEIKIFLYSKDSIDHISSIETSGYIKKIPTRFENPINKYLDRPTLIEGVTNEEKELLIIARIKKLIQAQKDYQKIFIITTNVNQIRAYLNKEYALEKHLNVNILPLDAFAERVFSRNFESIYKKRQLIKSLIAGTTLESRFSPVYRAVRHLEKLRKLEKVETLKEADIKEIDVKKELNWDFISNLFEKYLNEKRNIDGLFLDDVLWNSELNLEEIYQKNIDALIIDNFFYLEEEKVDFLFSLLGHIKSILVVNNQLAEMYSSEEYVVNFKKEFNEFPYKSKIKECAAIPNEILTFINALNGSKLSSSLNTNYPVTIHVFPSMEQEINWIISHIQEVEDTVILTKTRKNLELIKASIPNIKVLTMDSIDNRTWKTIFISGIDKHFASMEHETIDSRLLCSCALASTEKLFITSGDGIGSDLLRLPSITSQFAVTYANENSENSGATETSKLQKIICDSHEERIQKICKEVESLKQQKKNYSLVVSKYEQERELLSSLLPESEYISTLSKKIILGICHTILTVDLSESMRILGETFSKYMSHEFNLKDYINLLSELEKNEKTVKPILSWISNSSSKDSPLGKQIINDLIFTSPNNLENLVNQLSIDNYPFMYIQDLKTKCEDHILIILDNHDLSESIEKIYKDKNTQIFLYLKK